MVERLKDLTPICRQRATKSFMSNSKYDHYIIGIDKSLHRHSHTHMRRSIPLINISQSPYGINNSLAWDSHIHLYIEKLKATIYLFHKPIMILKPVFFTLLKRIFYSIVYSM